MSDYPIELTITVKAESLALVRALVVQRVDRHIDNASDFEDLPLNMNSSEPDSDFGVHDLAITYKCNEEQTIRNKIQELQEHAGVLDDLLGTGEVQECIDYLKKIENERK